MIYILSGIVLVILSFVIYILFHWLRILFYLKKLSIGEISKINWDLRGKYENLSAKERFYFGWIYINLIKMSEKRLQELIDKI